MSGWDPEKNMHFGRGQSERLFFWWCPQCKASGREELMTSCYQQGQKHWRVNHG